jgi:hypothetical protein
MFKLEIAPLVYYFDTESDFDDGKSLFENHGKIATYNIMSKCAICINTNTQQIIKSRNKSITELIENSIEIEQPRKELTIIVHGRCGSGKTRVAALINKLLHEEGFMTDMEFIEEHPQDVYFNLDEAIDVIKGCVKIKIKEKNVPRNGVIQ